MLKREGNKQYFGYNIKVESSHYSEESDEEGDTWCEIWEHNISDMITKADDGQVPDVVTAHELEVSDTVFLVYAIWSSGDSFGWANRRELEPVAIFQNEEEARKFSKVLEKTDIEKPFQYKTSDGQEFYCEKLWWSDFFTSLETVDYKPVILVDTIKKEEIR